MSVSRAHVCSTMQSCLTLWDPMDCSPPGSSIHGILQARILEWVVISYSRGSFWPRTKTVSLGYPALAGEFTSKPWEALKDITFAQSHTASQYQGWMKPRFLWWKLKFLTTYHGVYFFFFFLAIKCPPYSLERGQSDPGVSPSQVSSVSPLPKENGRFQKFRKLLSDLSEDHLFKGILETVSDNVLPFKISFPEPQCLADSNYRDLTVLEIFRFFDLKTQSL